MPWPRNNNYRSGRQKLWLNESRSSQLKSRFIEIDSIDEELSEEHDNNSNIDINAINKNDDTELPVNNIVDDIKEKQAEVNDLTKSISRLSIH